MYIDFDCIDFHFNKYDYASLKECIFNALEIEDISDEYALQFWDDFPNNLKMECLFYGIDDTPTIEKMCDWLIKNKK